MIKISQCIDLYGLIEFDKVNNYYFGGIVLVGIGANAAFAILRVVILKYLYTGWLVQLLIYVFPFFKFNI